MEKFLSVLIAIVGVLVLLVLVSALLAYPVMWLWNGTLIKVFPMIHAVDFWQAWGLNLLSGFLFKLGASNKAS